MSLKITQKFTGKDFGSRKYLGEGFWFSREIFAPAKYISRDERTGVTQVPHGQSIFGEQKCKNLRFAMYLQWLAEKLVVSPVKIRKWSEVFRPIKLQELSA